MIMTIQEFFWNLKHWLLTFVGWYRALTIRVAPVLPYLGSGAIYYGFFLLFSNRFFGSLVCFGLAGIFDLVLLDLDKPMITAVIRNWLGKPIDFALLLFFIVGGCLWCRPEGGLDMLAVALAYTIACHLHLDEL
jgi:hypothetical protein